MVQCLYLVARSNSSEVPASRPTAKPHAGGLPNFGLWLRSGRMPLLFQD